jgi:hypothetical protein
MEVECFLGEVGSRSTSNGLFKQTSTLIHTYVLYFKISAGKKEQS